MNIYKGVLLVFALSLIYTSSSGQVEQSQDTVVYTLADTTRAWSLLLESYALMNQREFEKAIEKVYQAKEIYSHTVGTDHEQVIAMWDMAGKINYSWEKYDDAIEAFENAIEIFERLGKAYCPEGKELCNNLIVTYISAGNYEDALGYANETLEAILQCPEPDSLGIAQAYRHIGTIHQYLGQHELAIEHHEKSLNLFKRVSGEKDIEVASSYMNIGSAYGDLGELKKSIENLEKALRIYRGVAEGGDYMLTVCLNNIGMAYSNQGEFKKGKKMLEESLELRRKMFGEKHTAVATSLNNLGSHLMRRGDYYQAIVFFQKAIETIPGNLGEENVYIHQYLNNIGVCYNYLGDVEKAIKFHEQALKVRLKVFGENQLSTATSLYNLAVIYLDLDKFGIAEKYFKKAIEIYSVYYPDTPHPHIPTLYNGLGLLYSRRKEFERARKYYLKSIEACRQIGEDAKAGMSTPYNNLSLDYLEAGDFEKAIYYCMEALKIRSESYPSTHPELLGSYENLGEILYKNNQLEEAEETFRTALSNMNYSNTEQVYAASSWYQLAEIMNNMGLVLKARYLNDNQIEHLYGSRNFFSQAIKVFKFQSSRVSSSSKVYLSKHYNKIYDGYLRTNLLLYQLTDSLHYLTEGFSFAERSKAFLLYEAMQESKALHVAGIPDSLLEKEYNLRIENAYYDKKRQEMLSEGLSEIDTAILELGEKSFSLEQEYEQLKKRFEKEYPEYYNAKYGLSTIGLGEVQSELLQPGQSLLEYMVGDSTIFIFLVKRDQYEVLEIKRDFPLEEWVRNLTKEGIYGYYTLPAGQRTPQAEEAAIISYTRAAQQLYEKLVAPVKEQLTEEVVIIPDGILGYVPFEALLTGEPKRVGAFTSYPFLLYEHQVSYCYSATLLREMRQKQHREVPAERLLAMAPFFRGDVEELVSRVDTLGFLALRDSLSALPASGEEAAWVAKILEGDSYFGADASLQRFRGLAGQYRIVHLSTHGKADDRVGDYAYLAFGAEEKGVFEKLYARDLYNYTLNADMVVLSACETGIGKLQKGEGIISLARAFAYAGAKSIFTTLWQVSDEKTKGLMVDFYRNLKKGETKDAALRKAKLEYLEENKGKGEATHPFFWAGLIGIGDMSAVK